jgi:AAA+ superfamily predicted ATPase
MLVQMESKNPITDILLKDDLGIDKIGYRARIINKLQEDAKKFNNKLKNSTLIFGKGETEKICECIIF